MHSSLASITSEDIALMQGSVSGRIKSTEILNHPIFSNPIQLIKLTSILFVLREYDQISNLVEHLSGNSELSDLAALEMLHSNQSSRFSLDDIHSKHMRVCLRLNAAFFSVNSEEISALPLQYKAQVIKHAALSSNYAIMRLVSASLSKFEQELIEEFTVSVARVAASFFDGSQANFDHDVWIKYCTALYEGFCGDKSERKLLLRSYMASLHSNKGEIDSALKLIIPIKKDNARLFKAISLRQALRRKDYRKAIRLADDMISMSSPGDLAINFSRETAELVLVSVNRLLTSYGLHPFVISGTLLGFIREGRIFAHDKDFDIGILGWESQYDVAAALLKSGEFSFSAKDLRGDALYTLAVRHVRSGIVFDIFFFHDRSDHFLHGIDHRVGYTLNYRFSKFKLIRGDFLGEEFFIPENSNQMLSENYGDDWRRPNKNYFVRLESPALVKDNGGVIGFAARHEMLDLIHTGGSVEKAVALVSCIKGNVPRKFQPTQKTFDQFLQSVGGVRL